MQKQKKSRYSLVRERMIEVIKKSQQPVSYFDIQKSLLEKSIHANKTTIYRELHFLAERNIIRELQFRDGVAYYEINNNDHHHHIVCTDCETIDHVELEKDLDREEESILKNKKFKVLSHSLEFYGLCNNCAKNH